MDCRVDGLETGYGGEDLFNPGVLVRKGGLGIQFVLDAAQMVWCGVVDQ